MHVLLGVKRTGRNMQFIKHTTADAFLAAAQATLEKNEAANNLMLGLASRVQKFPERIRIQPYICHGARRPEDCGSSIDDAAVWRHCSIELVVASNCACANCRNLCADKWPVPFVNGEAHAADAFAKLWQSLTGVEVKRTICERVYQLDHVIAPHWPAGLFRLANKHDLDLLAKWVNDFHHEALPDNPPVDARDWAFTAITDGDVYLWEVEGEPVSMARKSRGTAHGQCIGPVYTPSKFRGRGYASAVTAKLSQLILSSGKRFAMLFTDLSIPHQTAFIRRSALSRCATITSTSSTNPFSQRERE